MSNTKTETVEEFLARGGEIEKVEEGISGLPKEEQKEEEREVNVKNTTVGPVKIMTLEEGSLMFGKKIKRKKKAKIVDKKKIEEIASTLPEEVRKRIGL